MAVSPPSFLSEAEAIEIIRNHLLQAGLTLASDPVSIEGPIALTDPDGVLQWAKEKKSQKIDSASTASEEKDFFDEQVKKVSLDKPVRGTIQFDLATADGKVLIEYLSRDDMWCWEWQKFIERELEREEFVDEQGRKCIRIDRLARKVLYGSTAASYDFSDLARRFSRFMADEPDDKQRTVGIFFDPLVEAKNLPKRPEYSVPSPSPYENGGKEWNRWRKEMQADPTYQAQLKEWEEMRRKMAAEQAEESLKRQIDHFIAHLREKGTLPR